MRSSVTKITVNTCDILGNANNNNTNKVRLVIRLKYLNDLVFERTDRLVCQKFVLFYIYNFEQTKKQLKLHQIFAW